MNKETIRKGKVFKVGGSMKNNRGRNMTLPAKRKLLINNTLLSDCLSKIFQEACVIAVKMIIVKRKGVKFFYWYL